ncbi:MAG TPA: DUF1611 domain-containing protein [Spirochaetia bacterium]|nr:DUF1611 domain-containing protein [Spirochaetia bacterium]
MAKFPEGNAVVYCDGAFNTTYGKTAHGLVRFTKRYRVLSLIDRRHAGSDAGEVLDGYPRGIPVVASLDAALAAANDKGVSATHFVVGVATDGGVMDEETLAAVKQAISKGLNVDSGLHDLMGENTELVRLAARKGVVLRDVRRTPPRREMHAFSGRIDMVGALRIALLGTDSAVGKRTTAWILVRGLQEAGLSAEMIGTGQTAWMQGVEYGIIMDSLLNDFVAGEIENQVVRAWEEKHPDVIVVEGQGSLMNPAYPGGFEILAAARPHAIVLQHSPSRVDYDGFPGYPLHPIETQIKAIEFLSGRPVVAVAVNHEGLGNDEIAFACTKLSEETGLPACDPIVDGPDVLVKVVRRLLDQHT